MAGSEFSIERGKYWPIIKIQAATQMISVMSKIVRGFIFIGLEINLTSVISECSHIYVVSPCHNEEQGIGQFYRELSQAVDPLTAYRFTFVFVDDGSTDNTLAKLNSLANNDSRVVVLSLSRNFGHQIALIAGIDFVPLDAGAIIMLDSDLQHPPQHIAAMLASWRSGNEIVSMVRRHTTDANWLKRSFSKGYYRLLSSISDIPLVAGAADFCLLGSQAFRAIKNFTEQDLFLRGAIAWIGYKRELIEFDAPPRFAGTSSYSFKRMLDFALTGILSFSTSPMRMVAKLGLCMILFALIVLAYALFVFSQNGTVRGWTSLLAVVTLFGGFNMLSVGVIGEYLGRTFAQVKGRPRYLLNVPTDTRRR